MNSLIVSLSASGAFKISSVISWTIKRDRLFIRLKDTGQVTSSDIAHLLEAKQLAVAVLLPDDGRITRVHNVILEHLFFENVSSGREEADPIVVVGKIRDLSVNIVTEDLKPRQYIEALESQIAEQVKQQQEAQAQAAAQTTQEQTVVEELADDEEVVDASYNGKHTIPVERVATEDDIDVREPLPVEETQVH